MLLIIFLRLFDKLRFVSGYCEVGNLKLAESDWTKEFASVLKYFL